MKVLKKLLALTSICLSFYLLCQATTLVVAAAEPISVPEVTYQLDKDGNVIIDAYYTVDSEPDFNIRQVIRPDGNSDVILNVNGEQTVMPGAGRL